MEQDEASSVDRFLEAIGGTRTDRNERRYRRIPPAITPIQAGDVLTGVRDHRSGVGREEFRNRIASFLDAEDTATYTSYRRALCACLLELAAHADDDRTDVHLPAFCSSDFVDAIEGAGLTPVRYDVDPETLAFDGDSLRSLSTENALAVVVVNALGYGSPMERLEEHCRETDTYLIETLGYALGSEYNGDRLGTFGDCSVINFQQGKPIPVGGGMVVSRTDAFEFTDAGRPAVSPNAGTLAGYGVFGRPRMYYLYSQAADWLTRIRGSSARYSTHPESKFDVPYEPPFATMSDFQGSVATRVFDRLETHRRQRERTASAYATRLADCPHVRHLRPVEGLSKHQYVRYPLVIDSAERRDQLVTALSDVGVETAALYDWPPIDGSTFPGAARLQDGIITLPTHPYVDETDRKLICRTTRDVLSSFR